MRRSEARAILGLGANPTREALTRQFRSAVKAARPDREGGDPERFRVVIEAYRLLCDRMDDPAPPANSLEIDADLQVGVDAAFRGAVLFVHSRGVRMAVSVPKGVRTGDIVHADAPNRDCAFRVVVVGDADWSIVGDDLWITVRVDPWLLEEGGRLEVPTPLGAQKAWIPRGFPEGAMLRLKGLGLPARDGYPQGHAYLKFTPDPSLAGSLMRKIFDSLSAPWAPNAASTLRVGDVR